MVLADVALVTAGLVLLFLGAALSMYAVALVGFLLGASGAYVVAPSILGAVGSGGLVGLAVAIVVGGLLGAALAYVALSVATAVRRSSSVSTSGSTSSRRFSPTVASSRTSSRYSAASPVPRSASR